MTRVRMPADIEADDKLLAGLSARQLLIIGLPGVGVWALLSQLHAYLPLGVRIAIAVPLLGAAVAVALVRRDGLGLDQLALAALRFARSAKHRATHSDAGSGEVPSWIGAHPTPLPAPLNLPAEHISDDGIVDLGEHGSAVIVSCSAVNFGLRTEQEKSALVAGFAGFLHSLHAASAQILIRAESVRLDPLIATLEEAAPHLWHPRLETAAHEHARFLAELADTRDLLYRQVLLVMREPAGQAHQAASLRRRAEDAVRALASAGSHAVVLDGPAVAAVLASATAPTTRTPPPAGLAAPEAVITGPPALGGGKHP